MQEDLNAVVAFAADAVQAVLAVHPDLQEGAAPVRRPAPVHQVVEVGGPQPLNLAGFQQQAEKVVAYMSAGKDRLAWFAGIGCPALLRCSFTCTRTPPLRSLM